MRRFNLIRTIDYNGNSGIGIVAEGIEFSDGIIAMHWKVENKPVTTTIFDKIEDVMFLHNHEETDYVGGTKVEWID